MAAVCEIKPAVRAEERSVQAGRVGREMPACDDHFPLIRHPIAIGVPQPDQVRRSRHVEAAVIPDSAGGKRQLVREDRAPVVDPVAVGVLQHADHVIGFGRHLVRGERVARRFAQEQAAAIVDGAHHGIVHQPFAGHPLHFEAGRHVDRSQARQRFVFGDGGDHYGDDRGAPDESGCGKRFVILTSCGDLS